MLLPFLPCRLNTTMGGPSLSASNLRRLGDAAPSWRGDLPFHPIHSCGYRRVTSYEENHKRRGGQPAFRPFSHAIAVLLPLHRCHDTHNTASLHRGLSRLLPPPRSNETLSPPPGTVAGHRGLAPTTARRSHGYSRFANAAFAGSNDVGAGTAATFAALTSSRVTGLYIRVRGCAAGSR